jgi:glucose/arabinose dehydrogenase
MHVHTDRGLGVAVALAMTAVLTWSASRGQAQSQVQTQTVISDLQIPWAAEFAPDGRLFLTERPGRIRIVRDGRLDPQPWATIRVAHVGEGGLLGLALAPDFARSGFVYVYHTYEADGRLWNRVIRLIDQNGRGQINRVIFNQIPGAVVHDGGRIKFGPDGKLYIGTGDARLPSQAQDRAALGGKILRINPDGSIPTDNPFAGSPVYSFGHRNVQGLAWHPQAKTLYASEHGPTGEFGLCCRDKVNVIEASKNYGWPVVTGRAGDVRFVDPIADSGPTITWAPSGILVPSSGPWKNSVLIAELRGASLRKLLLTGSGFTQVRSQEVYFQDELGRLRDVFEGPNGTLYLLTNNTDGRGSPRPHDDRILKIVFS